MKNMKKILALCLVLAMMLTVTVPVFAASGYSFTYKNVTIKMGKNIGKKGKKNDLVKKMKLKRKDNGGSCLSGAGRQYKYTKKGLTITADQKKSGGDEYITSIVITKKSFPTKEGVKVGDTLQTLKSKYSNLKKSGSKYSATSGSDKITFTVKKNKVKKIQYM